MSKMSTDLVRHALNGPTMGTRWSALFHIPNAFDVAPVVAALQAAVSVVNAQMSTWKPDSDLMQLNAHPLNVWFDAPDHLLKVLETGLAIGRASGGAFDIGMGDAVAAWGFGTAGASAPRIKQSLGRIRQPAHEVLELDPNRHRARKHSPIHLDLSGIAKGYGVDRLSEVLAEFAIPNALVAIDGELRAMGLQPDKSPWNIAIEKPNHEAREPHAILALQDAAVATSGDYRHWIDVGERRLSHTMDPEKGGPLLRSPASVTVIHANCMSADAWATALMVKGSVEGAVMAQKYKIDALFIDRDGDALKETRVGNLFHPAAESPGSRACHLATETNAK